MVKAALGVVDFMSFCIVSGADQKYFAPLTDLLKSLEGFRRHLAILDFGLTPAQISHLEDLGIAVVGFTYPHDYKARLQVERSFPGFGAMLARPYLNEIFPTYETLMWMDADTWVHDLSAVTEIIEQASHHGLAAIPEVDRNYVKFSSAGKHIWEAERNTYKRCFGIENANRMALLPVINSGVWAARSSSPLWAAWRALLQQGLAHLESIDDESRIVEQAAFNLAIESAQLGVRRFPATYNWMVSCAIPAWHVHKQALVDPHPPHDEIKIVHLSTHFLSRPLALPLIGHTRSGIHATLRRSDILQLREVLAKSLSA